MYLNRFADLMFFEHSEQIVRVSNLVVVNAYNDIAQFEITHIGLLYPTETGLRRTTATGYLHDKHTIIRRQINLIAKRSTSRVLMPSFDVAPDRFAATAAQRVSQY